MKRATRITSIFITATGLILLAFNVYQGGRYNVALPLVFFILAGGFFILIFQFRQKWQWWHFLYIPAFLSIAFGIIFLLNVLTRDWKSWAYAWLLLIAAIGIGLLFVARQISLHPLVKQIGWGMTIIGMTFFCVFGVITGGLFIQVMAPILLAAAGITLRLANIEPALPASLAPLLHFTPQDKMEGFHIDKENALLEPLSSRELEVLKLIESGFSNQQIAEKLTVASSTVKTHINNIYTKMGVQNRVQAINLGRERGLFK